MKKYSAYLSVLITSIILFAGVPLLYAWTAPATGVVPPAQNAPGPITVSSSNQNKLGVLGLGGLAVFGKTLLTETKNYVLPSAKSTMLLGVNGAIGAKEYCDEKGMNCVTTLGGGSTNGLSISSGQKVVCGGWDVKYGSNGALNAWGCAVPASNPVCPTGYDTIKSSKVTISLAEHTNLCVLQNAGGNSNSQIIDGWPNAIMCNATNGTKKILRLDGYYAKGRTRYSDKPGYMYGEVGSVFSIYFDATTKNSIIYHGNGDYGGNVNTDFAGCINKSITDPVFTWL